MNDEQSVHSSFILHPCTLGVSDVLDRSRPGADRRHGRIIAYYGDLIGRKYGKKRLSWFGLRPKYTAILITSISGALISTITMAAMFLLVPPVRHIIMDGEAAIRLTKTLTHKNETLKLEVARGEELRDPLKRLAQINAQLDTERINLRKVHAQLAAMQSERDSGARGAGQGADARAAGASEVCAA